MLLPIDVVVNICILFFIRYQESSIECLVFLINILGEKCKELYHFERPWRDSSLKCFELILFITRIRKYRQKFEALKSIAPFITRWVSLSIGQKFANNNPTDSLKELKVYRQVKSNVLIFTVLGRPVHYWN